MGNDHENCHAEDVDKLEVSEALEQIRSTSVETATELYDVTESQGRVLAEEISVREDLPRFDQSAMDGYAVRSEDLREVSPEEPPTLPCVKQAAAGQSDLPTVEPGEVARIFTGAPVPEGADAVVIQEKVDRTGDTITFQEPAEPGANIRRQGEEVEAGTQLLEAGEPINTGTIGLLLSQGYEEVPVYRAPSVGIVATGDELIDPSKTPGLGQKRDTNSFLIRNIIRKYANDVDVQRLADERDLVKDELGDLLDDRDLIFISGGVSVGDRDYVRPVLHELGVEQVFWKVNQKPGKPLYFGEHDGTKILGLPGNPVSASVSLLIYGIPLLRNMLGYPEDALELNRGVTRLKNTRENTKDRTEFVRARTTSTPEGYRSKILDHQGSHMLTGLARANSLVVLPADLERITPDDPVTCYFLEDSPARRQLPKP